MMKKPPKITTEEESKDGVGEIDEYTRGYIDSGQEKIKKELSELLKKEVSSRASKIAEKIKSDLQNYVSQNQIRIIEALAIFVALFTFISINIQIFTKTQDLRSATIFMLLMALISMIMISFPIILLRANKNDEKPKWVWFIFVTAIILLVAILLVTLWLNIPLNVSKN